MHKEAIIRKLPNGKYRLYSHDGKNLGTFDSKEKAEKHEREVQFFKHKKGEAYSDKDMEEIYRKRDPYNGGGNDIGTSRTFPENSSDFIRESNPGLFKFLDPKAITPSTGSPADLMSMPMGSEGAGDGDFNLTFTYDKEKNILSGNISWSEEIGDDDIAKVLSMLQLQLAGKLHALRQLELDDLTNVDFESNIAHFVIHNASPAVNPMDPVIEIESEYVPTESMLSRIQKTNKGFKRENVIVHLEKLDNGVVTGTVEVFFSKKQIFKFTVDKDIVNNRPVFRSQDFDRSVASGTLKDHNDIAAYVKERVNEEAWDAITKKKLPGGVGQGKKKPIDATEEKLVKAFDSIDKKRFSDYDYHNTNYTSITLPTDEAKELIEGVGVAWSYIEKKPSGMPSGEFIYKIVPEGLLIIR